MIQKSTHQRTFVLGFILLLFCQLVIANPIRKKVKLKNDIAEPNAPCYIDLDLRECSIQLEDYVNQAQKLLSTLKYIDSNGKKHFFSKTQTETVSYQSVISEINNFINTNNCVIAGIRIFNTLDISSGSIKLYFAPTYASEPIQSGNYYDFPFNYSTGELSIILANKSAPVYIVSNGKLSDISSNQSEINLAIQRWEDYKRNIQIDWLIQIGDRSFKQGSDINSVFFPLEEIELLQQSASGQSNMIVSSAIKKYNSSYINTINLGNILPDSGHYPRQITPNSGPEVSYFINMAANMGQLCPTKCNNLKATKVSANTYKFVN